jgi:hypothetical protein
MTGLVFGSSSVSLPGGATMTPNQALGTAAAYAGATATVMAGVVAGSAALATRSAAEILTETFGKDLVGTPLQRSLQVLEQIKGGTFEPPADLTGAHLDYYEQVAKAGKDTTGIQQVRLQIVEALLVK